MNNAQRRWVGILGGLFIGLIAGRLFVATRDPMILIFGIVLGGIALFFLVPRPEAGPSCGACAAKNVAGAKFCAQCSRPM